MTWFSTHRSQTFHLNIQVQMMPLQHISYILLFLYEVLLWSRYLLPWYHYAPTKFHSWSQILPSFFPAYITEHHASISNTDGPRLMIVWLTIFLTTMVLKLYTFTRNYTWKFEFGSFAGLVVCGIVLSPVILGRSAAAAPSQPGDQLIHLQPFCTHTTILFFTFSTVFNNLHKVFSILL